MSTAMSATFYTVIGLVIALSMLSKTRWSRLPPFIYHLAFIWFAVTMMTSAFPFTAGGRLVQTYVIGLAIFMLGYQLSPRDLVFSLFASSTLLIILSLGAGFLLPISAIHQPGIEPAVVGDWRGVFFHKNHAAAVTGANFIICTHLILSRLSLIRIVLIGLSCCFLYVSGGKNAAFAAALSSAAYVALVNLKDKQVVTALFLFACYAIISLVVAVGIFSSGSLDVSADAFTGRGEIWAALWAVFEQNPIAGGGYGLLFSDDGGLSVISGFLSSQWANSPTHGHNAFLELMASTGVVGITIVLIFIHTTFKSILRSIDIIEPTYIRLLLSINLYLMAHNVLESGLFDRKRFSWMIILLIFGCMTGARHRFSCLSRSHQPGDI